MVSRAESSSNFAKFSIISIKYTEIIIGSNALVTYFESIAPEKCHQFLLVTEFIILSLLLG